ncbi:protein-cysteine N-palmitoyltransferase HHAT isoform X1 [Bombus affinis]|uniref:protein-cysteine N-palmitoyltransferase HHAT isoform X1 n=2 Tax=Bombus affinis TaxID=309941 RepID=UPI0021B6FE74|nr:protein-cysteine N-palmitoyltransferase HHAT isoform X1 [Bombus affinis]XP_050600803.1 protein-cysteine N-palmitoyltransferase HHAT isoform X1 [Bombus affinis]
MTSATDKIIKLYKYESFLYFLLWTGAVLYSIYEVFLINSYFTNYDDLYGDFAPGWTWIGREQDVSDEEWRIWIPLMIKLIPWLFLHHFISHFIKIISNSMLLCCWYILISLLFLYYCIGTFGMLCALVHPSILYILTYKRGKSTIWMINILFLFIIHFLKIPDGSFQNIFKLNDEEHYILTHILCWVQLRSISYSMDNIKSHLENKCDYILFFVQNLLYKLAYCLYLPTLSLGPLVLYQEFINSVKGSFQFLRPANLGNFLFNVIRYIFWILFANFFLHFLYFNAIQYHPEVVQDLNPWALYGLGYCMGQFFLIKYVVVYGLNHTLCAIDNVKAPPQPKCVARIHLYSDMWKYFDQGLYKFLIRYIYVPSLKSNFNKLLASFLCFTFVFLWHGMQINIFIWAFLNFVGLNIESLIKLTGKNKYFLNIRKRYLSETNARRFHCILTSPLLAMSVISNFYFFVGEEIGNIYISRILHDTWYNTFVLLFFLYCCCQVSIDIKNWELQKYSKL